MKMIKLSRMAHIRQVLSLTLLVGSLLGAMSATAQGIVDNGCPNELGSPQSNCSKLSAGERITVMASECGYGATCPTTTPMICRSIINDSAVDYFVPWKKAEEWGAFLKQLTPMSPLQIVGDNFKIEILLI